LERTEGGDQVASTRKLRRELTRGIAKLRGLQQSVDPSVHDMSAKALAVRIREQAVTCLNLLDQYQASVPGRMWSYADKRCQPLRDELTRTEMLFRAASGEWERVPERLAGGTWWSRTDEGVPGDE
jgi:hypothetical protein